MKIDLDKAFEYRTRGGGKAVVLGRFTSLPDHFKYYGYISNGAIRGSACMWSPKGYARTEGRGDDPLDIVEYWEEREPELPKIDWSKYPDYVKYISRDEDGDVSWHTHVPEKHDGYYCVNRDEHPFGLTFSFPDNLEPDMGGCPWEDSLVERPRMSFSIPIPWDKIPQEYSVVAWDSSGGWAAYKYIPRPISSGAFSRRLRNVLRVDDAAYQSLASLGVSLPDPHCSKEPIFIRPGTKPIRDFDSDE